MTASEPTLEMVAFYERRTVEHIERVRVCLTMMESVTEHGDELNEMYERVGDTIKHDRHLSFVKFLPEYSDERELYSL